jgi:hypothetical protein
MHHLQYSSAYVTEYPLLVYKHNHVDQLELNDLELQTMNIWYTLVPDDLKSNQYYYMPDIIEIREMIGQEYLQNTNIEKLLDQNAYIWFRRESFWALKIANILSTSDFKSLHENVNHMYYDGTPMDLDTFFSVITAAQKYHNMNMYDQGVNLDLFINECQQ